MLKNNTNNKQNIEIAVIKEQIDFSCKKIDVLAQKVDTIIENHLPHLEGQIVKLDTNQKIVLSVMMMIIAGLIGLFFK